MGIKIGYDAKRYFNNATGLGNYSRTLIHYLDKYHAENQYVLFVHRKYASKGFNRYKVVKGKGQHAIWRSRQVRKEIASNDIQVYHGLSGELPARMKGGPRYVVTVHDIIFKLFPQWYGSVDRFFYNQKLRHALKVADSIVAVSQSTADNLKEYCDFDHSKLSIIYPTWNAMYETLNKEEIHVPLLPKNYLLFVGSFYERKNLRRVIRAMAAPECRNIPLVVVGDGKKRYKQVMLELIQQYKLERQVLLLENVYDELLKQLYLRAKAVIYPSLYEGFGLPVVEAWRCNKPVITSSNSSLSEIGTKACISLKDPEDQEEISHAIGKLFSDSEVYDQLVSEIPDHLEQFSPKTSSELWAKLYASLI